MITTGIFEKSLINHENGNIKDISKRRVKEYEPNTHPGIPKGTLNRVKFEDSLPKSKGFKRLPTNTNESTNGQ